MDKNDIKLITYMMPSYKKQCGIGQYSERLFQRIQKQMGNVKFDIYPHADIQSFDHYLKYQKPDIIHIHHEFSFFQSSKALGDILKDFKGKKYITLHTLLHDNSKFNEEIATSVTKVIVHAKKWLDKVPNSVHIPMCCNSYDASDYVSEDIFNFTKNAFVIATNGFIRRQKGFEKLLYTLKIMRERGINAKLLILAPRHFSYNEYEEMLVFNIEYEDMEDHVLMLRNYFTEIEKMKIMETYADIIVYPYDNSNMIGAGCSASIKDNLCLGVPIIVSDCSSFVDMGREVYRIENNQPETIIQGIQWVTNNNHVRDRLIKKSRERSIKDSWDNIAKIHIELYESH